MIDAQEIINELKTYNRYVRKKQEAIDKYNDLETQLEYIYNSYTSPAASNCVEISKFVNGRLVKKLIPLPKLDPDPNRKEVIRKGIICQQCELWDEREYYSRKIKQINDLLSDMPADLSKMLKDVYIKKKIQKVSKDKGYTVKGLYDHLRERIDEYLNSQLKFKR